MDVRTCATYLTINKGVMSLGIFQPQTQICQFCLFVPQNKFILSGYLPYIRENASIRLKPSLQGSVCDGREDGGEKTKSHSIVANISGFLVLFLAPSNQTVSS